VFCGGDIGNSMMFVCEGCKVSRAERIASERIRIESESAKRKYSLGDKFVPYIALLEIVAVSPDSATTTYPYTVKMSTRTKDGLVETKTRMSEDSLSKFHRKNSKSFEETMFEIIGSGEKIMLFDSVKEKVEESVLVKALVDAVNSKQIELFDSKDNQGA
jgi:hypothetical protein